jgi:hypothetical protein
MHAIWCRDLTGDLPATEGTYNVGVYAERVQPVIEAGLADMVEDGARIADCLPLLAAAGHTTGHLAGLLESGGEGAAPHAVGAVPGPQNPWLRRSAGSGQAALSARYLRGERPLAGARAFS